MNENAKIDTYKIEVVKTDEFEVSVDPNVWNKEALEEWSKVFWDAESTEEIAKSLADAVSRNGLERFYEGFGHVRTYFRDGSPRAQFKKNESGKIVKRTDDEYANGISIKVLSMDDDVETNLID